eukprot:Lankesteria_metandrocarpae@DN5099_c0_g2_i2.p1
MAGVVAQNIPASARADGIDENVTIEIFPILATEMSLLESIMMPFRMMSPITHDPEKEIAYAVLAKSVALDVVKGGSLAYFKCRIGDPEMQAIFDATNEEDVNHIPVISETVLKKPDEPSELRLRKPAADVPTRSHNMELKANLKQRTPLNPDDPFLIVTDVK